MLSVYDIYMERRDVMKETDQVIRMNDEYDESDSAQYIKSYMFIKGFAMGKNLQQTMMALSLARQLHDGQSRNDGVP